MIQTILSYGTLRPGCYNHARFGKPEKVGKTFELPGFTLYESTYAPYPFAACDNDGSLIVTEITYSKAAYDAIYRMERSAGYEARVSDGGIIFAADKKCSDWTQCYYNDWLKNPKCK